MAKLPEVDEFYTWHLDVCHKMTPLLLKGMEIAKDKVANGVKGWVFDDWLRKQNPDLIAEWGVVRSVMNLLSDSTPDSKDMTVVMDYFVETSNNKKKVPHIIQSLFAHNIASYMQGKKGGKPITLDQAFGLENKRGHPKRSYRLAIDVIGITKELIEKELELTLAIESYQEIQNEKNIDTETSTETLRTMFHEQKVHALMDVVMRSQVLSNFNPSDKAKDLIGKYWTAEQDPLKIGTNRKKS